MERPGVPRLRRVGCSRGSLRSRRCATGRAALPPPDAIRGRFVLISGTDKAIIRESGTGVVLTHARPLVRPPVEERDELMASLRKRGRVWYIRFTDADGVAHERKGCPDKRATEAMAAALEAEAARIRAGLTDAKAETRRRQAGRPLSEHLNEWRAHLIAKGATAKHAELHVGRARRVAALAAGGSLAEIDAPKTATDEERQPFALALHKRLTTARLADLTTDTVQRALATLKDGGRSLATCNHHRAAIRGFSRWARRDGRTADDALDSVSGFNAREDRRHDRRTIGVDDLRRLVATAHAGPTYRSMTGPARALCYRLAVATGLRFSEIGSITPESFDFGKEPAVVTILAAYTKNGEAAELPLPADVANDLARLVATIPSGQPVFALPARGRGHAQERLGTPPVFLTVIALV